MCTGFSCIAEDAEPVAPKKPAITLRATSSTPEYVVSRAVVPQENLIYNLTVIVFAPSDELFSINYLSVGDTPSAANGVLEMDITTVIAGLNLEDGYTIYVAANIGHNNPIDPGNPTKPNPNYYRNYFNIVGTESDANYWYVTMPSIYNTSTLINNSLYAMVMTGKHTTTAADNESSSIEIPLSRINTKVSYNVQLSSAATDAGMHIMGVRFCDMTPSTYLFGHATDIPLGDDEYITSDWLEPDAGNASASGSVYIYENRKGEGPDKNEPTGPPSPANATYMEILIDLHGKQFYCKVYLGTNKYTNYDLMRNCRYSVTVNINGINNMETDVRRVTVMDEDSWWYNTDGLLLHYDGIDNNGRENQRVTNRTPVTVTDAVGYITYSGGFPAGYTPPVTDDTPQPTRNRWKNIAPMTKGHFNLVLSRFSYPQVEDPANGWGPDCLVLSDGHAASVEYDDDRLRPQQFTIEVIFRSDPGKNTNSGGNDLYGFLYDRGAQPYVAAGVESYDKGFGFIANTKWTGTNYISDAGSGFKRSIVLQYDGMYMYAYYGNKMVYREIKRKAGPLEWPTAPVGSRCSDYSNTCTQLTLGKFYRCDGVQYFGRIYAFRFYNRVLSEAELTENFMLDTFRFGLPAPE